jgi:Protein of unknown function (DUF2568)
VSQPAPAHPSPFIAVNLGVRFLLELAMLVALSWVGGEIGSSWWVSVLLAIAFPLIAAVLWGMFIAPKAPRRLTDPAKLLVELVLFAAAVVGLAVVGHPVLAAVLAVVFVVNTVVLRLSHAEH